MNMNFRWPKNCFDILQLYITSATILKKHPISDIYHCESHTKVVGGRYLGDLSYAMFYGELPGRKQCPKLLLLEYALRAYTGHN